MAPLNVEETVEVVQDSPTSFHSAQLEQAVENSGVIFGGQIVGQSVAAALKTVDETFYIHSVQGVYPSPIKPDIPVQYLVDTIRDGKSFKLRSVRAMQADRLVWTALCGFQQIGDGSKEPHYQVAPPSVELQPDEGVTTIDKYERFLAERHDLSDQYRLLADNHVKWIKRRPQHYFNTARNDDDICIGTGSGESGDWMKAKVGSRDPRVNAAFLAYLTDHDLQLTLNKATNVTPFSSPRAFGMGATLNHTIHFYEPVIDMNEWHLFVFEALVVGHARGVTQSRIYREGKLIATARQEYFARTVPVPWGLAKL